MKTKITRYVASAVTLIGLTVGVRALWADCFPTEEGSFCMVCGQTACCFTVWNGDVMVKHWCED